MTFILIYQNTLTGSRHARVNSTNIFTSPFLGLILSSQSGPWLRRGSGSWKGISSWTATHIHLEHVSLTCLSCKRLTHILLHKVLKRVNWVMYRREISLHLQHAVPWIIHVRLAWSLRLLFLILHS